ncbi:unnamed protein product [Musa acuminata subsp. burmannicoides]
MAQTPLLFLNLMYIIVIGFASWNLNHFINGQTNYPGSVLLPFLVPLFAILADVLGAASKLAGGNHIRPWRIALQLRPFRPSSHGRLPP